MPIRISICKLILIGQPQLKDLLRSPQLVQFAQRVSSDFHLKPLNQAKSKNTSTYRLKAAGAQFQLFSDEACATIAHASQGIPRTINILCDTALVYGFAMAAETITAEIVTMVIENKSQYGVLPLQPLPTDHRGSSGYCSGGSPRRRYDVTFCSYCTAIFFNSVLIFSSRS